VNPHARLRALAEAATPPSGGPINPGNPYWGALLRRFQDAVSPSVVLGLLDRIEESESARDKWRAAGYDGIDAIADKLGRAESERDSALATIARLKAELEAMTLERNNLSIDATFYEGECERMRAVYEAAVEWSESFGELSKRLPPHVHNLRDAVDAATKGTP
jgi:hypothetical protein